MSERRSLVLLLLLLLLLLQGATAEAQIFFPGDEIIASLPSPETTSRAEPAVEDFQTDARIFFPGEDLRAHRPPAKAPAPLPSEGRQDAQPCCLDVVLEKQPGPARSPGPSPDSSPGSGPDSLGTSPGPGPSHSPELPVDPQLSVFPSEVCGIPVESRIVGGTRTQPGQWPWLAAVGYRVGGRFHSSCGGSLITSRHVLSAAHCFSSSRPDTVRLGEYNLKLSTDDASMQDFRIRELRRHHYNSQTYENDIILLVLDREVVYNDFIRPVCLPFSERNNEFNDESLTVVGWGKLDSESSRSSDVPVQATVPVVDVARCIADYQRVQEILRPVIDGRNLCAGDGSKDACGGDSGGPLLHLSPSGRYHVVGIVSFGLGCADVRFPGVYTRVTSFLDWIVSNVH